MLNFHICDVKPWVLAKCWTTESKYFQLFDFNFETQNWQAVIFLCEAS